MCSHFVLTESVFTEEPGPGPLIAPIGTQVRLDCSVTEMYIIAWQYSHPSIQSSITSDVPGGEQAFRIRNLTIENPSTTISHLIINGTEGNNQSVLSCQAVTIGDAFTRHSSRNVEVIFYGRCKLYSGKFCI